MLTEVKYMYNGPTGEMLERQSLEHVSNMNLESSSEDYEFKGLQLPFGILGGYLGGEITLSIRYEDADEQVRNENIEIYLDVKKNVQKLTTSPVEEQN